MALLQIAEPSQSAAPHQYRLAVGIDLGTTNSLVACLKSGQVETLPDLEGRHMLPSVVRYLPDGNYELGHAAYVQAAADPDNTIVSVKRLMGRGSADLSKQGHIASYHLADPDNEGMPYLATCAGNKSPVQVSSAILRALAARAEASLEAELEGAVITVPAYFDEAQRQATKDAAKLAGINLLRLLNEPTAAAVAYGLDKSEEGIIAVYDLGGGTFDISILRLTKGVFEVLATGGDSSLGGDDFDLLLLQFLAEKLSLDVASLSAGQRRYLLSQSKAVKEALSAEQEVVCCFSHEGIEAEINVSKEEFNALISSLVQRSLRACKRSLKDAGISVAQVQDLVMVGGSTRVPLVREKVAEFFASQLHADIDPDRVVAIGAAIQADILIGNRSADDMLLLDVIPLSLGLEMMGGLVEKIIQRNTVIPVRRGQEFTTYQDGQTAMVIHVLQGERETVEDNRSLARFVLRDIPPMAAGAAKIRVIFQVDADGLLNVEAKELSTGVQSQIQVQPSYGLSDNEISQMLQDSIGLAEEDMQQRRLCEQRLAADQLLVLLRHALVADGEALLNQQERDELQLAMQKLDDLRKTEDAFLIEQGVKELGQESNLFAERRMDKSIQTALQGQNIEQIQEVK